MSKRILLLSSVSPQFSAGLVADYVLALEKAGFSVDLLTKYNNKDYKGSLISAYDTEEPVRKNDIAPEISILKRGLLSFRTKISDYLFTNNLRKNIAFPYIRTDEYDYPIPSSIYMDKLEQHYDAVFVLYMQYMFTERSLKDICEKLHVPIYAFAIDMFLMTGGCYYPGKCNGFKKGCKKCPGGKMVFKKMIRTHFEQKKEIYKDIDLKLLGNTWVERFLKQSLATQDCSFYKHQIIINENVFSIKDKFDARKHFNIPSNKRFILLAGVANNTPRKGFKYLIKSVNLFFDFLSAKQRDEVALMLIGRGTEDIVKQFKIDLFVTGFLDVESLSLAYSSSDVFISPSLDDAGPSMVNQALMCGTPVVSFNIGTALDVVREGETGYTVDVKNYRAMACALLELFKMPSDRIQRMRTACRHLSMELSSINSASLFFKSII